MGRANDGFNGVQGQSETSWASGTGGPASKKAAAKEAATGSAGRDTKGKTPRTQPASQISEGAGASRVSNDSSNAQEPSEGSASESFPTVKQILEDATGRTQPERGNEYEFHWTGGDALRDRQPFAKPFLGGKSLANKGTRWRRHYAEYLLSAKRDLVSLLNELQSHPERFAITEDDLSNTDWT